MPDARAALLTVAAECRHLDDLRTEHHMCQAKAAADQAAVAEQLLYLIGRGVGGHVEILRPQSQQQVAHRAADQVGGVAGLIEAVQHAQRRLADVPAGNDVLVARNDPRSEEHTSELQSLMRISYAVFCLKKKNTIITQEVHYQTL